MIKVRFNLRKVVAIAICLAGTITISAQNVDVYAAGTDWKNAIIWKNGVELYSIADERSDGEFDCIYVSGNDVYTGNTKMTRPNFSYEYHPYIWKNGNLLYELETTDNYGFVDAIFVSGNDVYACGSENSQASNAVVWKNGKIFNTLAKGYYNSSSNYLYYYANAMQIIDNDVYVVGYSSGNSSLGSNKTWKNGTELYSGGGSSGIVVSGNNIYTLSGTAVWKNGTVFYQLDKNSTATSFCVVGNDVYVAGYENTIWARNVATVWKNGGVIYRLDDEPQSTSQLTGATADDICVIDNDVYVLTHNYSYKKTFIWKNGVVLYNSENQRVNAIFVQSSKTGIENIKTQNMQIYPNPVRDELFIQREIGVDRIEIYDIAGKQMFTGNLTNNNSINVSKLPAGIYVLKIGNHSEKFVKE